MRGICAVESMVISPVVDGDDVSNLLSAQRNSLEKLQYTGTPPLPQLVRNELNTDLNYCYRHMLIGSAVCRSGCVVVVGSSPWIHCNVIMILQISSTAYRSRSREGQIDRPCGMLSEKVVVFNHAVLSWGTVKVDSTLILHRFCE